VRFVGADAVVVWSGALVKVLVSRVGLETEGEEGKEEERQLTMRECCGEGYVWDFEVECEFDTSA
jgi:hypothetical protein